MKLEGFQVTNYRSILDSGWVDVSDISVVVGKNESGKTSLLRALHKLKPFKEEPYNLHREWPRGYRSKQSPNAVVVKARFSFTDVELKQLASLDPPIEGITAVEISKDYSGKVTTFFPPNDLPEQHNPLAFISRLTSFLSTVPTGVSAQFQAAVGGAQTSGTQTLNDQGVAGFVSKGATLSSSITAAAQAGNAVDQSEAQRITAALASMVKAASQPSPKTMAHNLAVSWIPTFIYMDDHKPFSGIAYLDQVKQRRDQQKSTEEDKTFLTIMKMAVLDLDNEVSRAGQQDKEQRILDMNDASLTLTKLVAKHWSQRKYNVRFEADGHHFITFVSDEVQPALVPLNERSKGFQWFFSFDMTFLHETNGTFKNAVILLDEPGLHLHAAAQRDLLERLKSYASGNQLIYTTHLPFMIDMARLDNIRLCVEDAAKGAYVTKDLYAADEHARFPILAALGLSMSQSLFIGHFNLVVEGVTDFWLISTIATILRSAGRQSLNDRIVVTPSGGATKAAYVGTMLQGQKLNVVVLLDSDPEGVRVADGLIKQWVMKDRHVLLIGSAIGRSAESALEDLLPSAFYLGYVNDSYSKELAGKPITGSELAARGEPQIVKKVEAILQARGFVPNSEGDCFNKGRVAKRIMEDLSKKTLGDLPDGVFGAFEKLFAKINESMPGLKE